MREVAGFAAGVAATAAVLAALTTERGRRVRDRLLLEAEPALRRDLEEWGPVLREVARAARLGAAEVLVLVDRIRAEVDAFAATGTDDADGSPGVRPGSMAAEVGPEGLDRDAVAAQRDAPSDGADVPGTAGPTASMGA